MQKTPGQHRFLKLQRLVPFCFLLIFSFKISGQIKYTENWCFFQNKRINFSSGSPALAGSSALFGWGEGCATISDKNTGQLLFYTDGKTVYNRNDVAMPNGHGLFGDVSSTQSSVIVPVPGDTVKYYIFTTTEDAGGGFYGMAYSIVDMTLQGGLGDVSAIKNVALNNVAAEKLAATQLCNGDYWVLCTNQYNNEFYAYKVGISGILPAVISAAGSTNQFPRCTGQMKFSPDGKKIAKAYYRRSPNGTTLQLPLGEVFNFDHNSGQVSNAIVLDFPGQVIAYGTEFSPGSNFLYCNAGEFTFQFDITIFNSTAINNSRTIIGSNAGWLGSLQLAPDAKIYKINIGRLDVINNPDVAGTACNFVNGQFTFSGSSGDGLPNFVSSFLIPHPAIPSLNIVDQSICKNDTALITAPTGFVDYHWNPAYNINTVSGPNVNAWPAIDTIYILTATSTEGCILSDTIQVTVHSVAPIYLGADTSLCKYDSLSLDAGQGFINYLWNTGGTAENITVYTAGVFNVTATDVFGCKSRDTMEILHIYDPPAIDLQHEINICIGEHFIIDATIVNASYTWQDNSTSPVFNVINSGTYWVNISMNGCKSSDTLIVSYKDCNCQLIIPNAITPNGDGINDKWILSRGNCFSQLDVYVYNRYGSLVYQKNNYHNDWQGNWKSKNLPDGTYYFIIHAIKDNSKQQLFKGNITLLR